MDHVVVPFHQDAAEGRHPPQIGVVGSTKGMHRRSALHHGRHQGVQVPQHVGHLVVESPPVTYRHHVDQQTLSPAVAEALDHQQHSEASAGRLGREPLVSVHPAIVLAGDFSPAFRPVRGRAIMSLRPSLFERGPAVAGGEGGACDDLADSI